MEKKVKGFPNPNLETSLPEKTDESDASAEYKLK